MGTRPKELRQPYPADELEIIRELGNGCVGGTDKARWIDTLDDEIDKTTAMRDLARKLQKYAAHSIGCPEADSAFSLELAAVLEEADVLVGPLADG